MSVTDKDFRVKFHTQIGYRNNIKKMQNYFKDGREGVT